MRITQFGHARARIADSLKRSESDGEQKGIYRFARTLDGNSLRKGSTKKSSLFLWNQDRKAVNLLSRKKERRKCEVSLEFLNKEDAYELHKKIKLFLDLTFIRPIESIALKPVYEIVEWK